MSRKILFGLLACSLVAGQASAQNWSFDARKIGLGSPGGDENLATQMIDEARNYGSVVLPFGLFQVMVESNKPNSRRNPPSTAVDRSTCAPAIRIPPLSRPAV